MKNTESLSQSGWISKVKNKVCNEAAQVFANIWLPKLIKELAVGDSPPEELLALVLEVVLWDEIHSRRIEIKKQEKVISEKVSAKYYKPDFIIHQLDTNAKMILECDGFSYHERDPKQFSYERKRTRELQRMGFFVFPFSADELFRNPWAAGLEVVDCINDKEAQHKFLPIDIPDELVAFAISFERPTLGERRVTKDRRANVERRVIKDRRTKSNHSFNPKSSLSEQITTEEIKKKIQTLPIIRNEIGQGIQNMRKQYPRAYEPWSDEEDEWLVLVYKKLEDPQKLVSIFQRQIGAINSRLRKKGF